MEEKIRDIRNSIDNGCYMSALALALTFPDICGQVEYPNEKEVGVRYISWFDEFVFANYQNDGSYTNELSDIEFNGVACYALRCAYLHSGNTNIENEKRNIKINKFNLCLSSNDDNGVYVDSYQIIEYEPGKKYFNVLLDVRKFCRIMCDVTEMYYKDHGQKKLFSDHSIHILNIEVEMQRYNSG